MSETDKLQNDINICYLKFLRTLVATVEDEIGRLTILLEGATKA